MLLCFIYGRVAESSITDALFSLAGPGYAQPCRGKIPFLGFLRKKALRKPAKRYVAVLWCHSFLLQESSSKSGNVTAWFCERAWDDTWSQACLSAGEDRERLWER